MFRVLLILLSAMPLSATNFVGSAAESGAGKFWDDLGPLTADDGTDCICGLDPGETLTKTIDCSQFGFSVPTGATVVGIEVLVERFSSNTGTNIRDHTIQLRKAGVAVGDNKADTSTEWPGSATLKTYGSSSDLWGATWAVGDVNHTGFGVSVKAQRDDGVSRGARIDYIKISVYYDIGGSSSITFSPSATIDGPAAISGSATVTLSPTATIDGPAEISGASSITFTPSATIDGPAGISGAATITFTASADIVATGDLAGATTITFTASGLAVDLGTISGTATITFTPTASIEATGALSGSASITFSPTADIAGEGALSGGTVVIFSPSATIDGVGELTGQTSITFSVSGMYDVPPEKALKYRSRPHVTLAGGQRANVR